MRFHIYSATADEIQERLEKGLLDLGILTEPADIGRYEFIRLPKRDQWGVWVDREHPLAARERVTPQDLLGVPLLLPQRERVQQELAGWFGDSFDRLEIAGTFNLILNAANMIRNGVGIALGFLLGNLSDDLRFIPLSPALETGSVLVWKKDQAFSPTAAAFLRDLRRAE